MLVAFASLYLLLAEPHRGLTSPALSFEMEPVVRRRRPSGGGELRRHLAPPAHRAPDEAGPGPTSQLAGNALGRVIPGGMPRPGRFSTRCSSGQARRAAGSPPRSPPSLRPPLRTVLALPLLSLPAIIGGTPVAQGPSPGRPTSARVSSSSCSSGDPRVRLGRPLKVVGRASTWMLNRTIRRKNSRRRPAERLLHERDSLRVAFGARWKGGRRRRRRQVDPRVPRAARLPARGRRGAEPVARAPRVRRRGLPRDDPADAGRPRLRRGGPDGPPRPRGRLSRRRRRGDPRSGSSPSGFRSRRAASRT